MTGERRPSVRRATAEDAREVARLLHAFNSEFGDPTPGVEALTKRLGPLISDEEVIALLAGEGPDGFATLRFRPAVLTPGDDAYLEELYVVPELRGHGVGRTLLDAAMALARERGAGRIDLNTSEADEAAIGLYESAGFTNREGDLDGPLMIYYERDL